MLDGGLAPRTQSAPPTHLIIVPDADDIRWTQLRNRIGHTIALQDVRKPLRRLLWPLADALAQRNQIKVFEYASDQCAKFRVNNKPFDAQLLGIKSLEEILSFAEWWVRKDHLKHICAPSLRGKQPHPEWVCECGQKVPWDKDTCTNRDCPSWEKWFICTGQRVVTALPVLSASA